jgi:Leucine-rich repeat (LRR) protein
VLQKCGGLPQVIVALGDFFAERCGGFEDCDDNFMRLLETHPTFGSLRGLFDWVHSYFHSCPDWLKPCIFYLSIFPVKHKIRRRRLVRRWIAEGYSRDTKEKTADESGEEFFVHLRKLNMVQVPGSTILRGIMRMPLCQVNGFFREYIVSRSMEENLVFELEGHCSMNSQQTGRHLTIGSTWDRDKIVYQSIDFSRLRSLTVFGRWEPFFISDKMRILRVLDLEDTSSVTDADLQQMVKLLPRLKFLSLRGCKEITRLPDSLGGLRQLQTLDIRHTSIVALPRSIISLLKLQHIRAGTTVQLDIDIVGVERPQPPSASINRVRGVPCQLLPGPRNNNGGGGIEVPRGIGKMVALNNISVIDVSAASGRLVLEELKNLTQLRKLGVSGIKQENCLELFSAISGHAHLTSLSLWLDKKLAAGLDAISPPPKKLKSLKLYGQVDKLPAWIKLLSSLRKLKLQLTMITQDEVDLLKDLPNLNTLHLSFMDFQYGELRFRGRDSFPNLWVLEIACNSRLQSVTFDRSLVVMSTLEVLKIRCSNVSSLKFSGLEHLQSLKEVSLTGSYQDNVKEHLRRQLDGHRRKLMKPALKDD